MSCSILSRLTTPRGVIALALGGLLAACGGDGGTTEPTPVPDVFSGQVSASQTAGIYVSDSTLVSMVVTNQNGQTAAGRQVVFALSAGSASLSGGPVWTTDSNGRATTVVRSDTPGSATVAGYLGTSASGAAQGSVNLSFIPDLLIVEASVSDEGDLRMSAEPTVTVSLTNQNDDPIEGQAVTFAAINGTGQAQIDGDATVTTDAAGEASVTLMAVGPGTVTVHAFIGDAAEGDAAAEVPLRFVVGPPAALAFLDQPSVTLPGAEFIVDPIVLVLDDEGWMVEDAEVEIQIEIDRGPDLQGPTTVTSSDGLARFSGLRVDVPKAAMQMIASSPGLESARSDDLTSMYRQSFGVQANTTCMPDVSGVVYCWGSNSFGQAGTSAADTLFTPTAVGGSPEGYGVVKNGANHTCALTRATKLPWCWGAPSYLGYEGDAAFEPRGTPLPVNGFSSDWLITGNSASCSLVGSGPIEGRTVCWGNNRYGQLGANDTDDRPNNIALVRLLGERFVSVANGSWTSCGVTESHDLYCWGSRAYGGLGDGIVDDTQAILVPVQTGFDEEWRSVSGGLFTFCATTLSGEIHCWGDNRLGQAGSDAGDVVSEPTQIDLREAWLDVDVGGQMACGITARSVMFCWGTRFLGGVDVGNGFSQILDSPPALSNFSVGFNHACLVDSEGTPYCWGGNNRLGQHGHSQGRYAPVDGNLRIVTEPF
jgi:alpha-tubulin suppressor-like RCC1 family protein